MVSSGLESFEPANWIMSWRVMEVGRTYLDQRLGARQIRVAKEGRQHILFSCLGNEKLEGLSVIHEVDSSRIESPIGKVAELRSDQAADGILPVGK